MAGLLAPRRLEGKLVLYCLKMSDLTPAPGNSADFDLDLLASALRADEGDIDTFFDVLAGKLTDILGSRCEIRQSGGRFHKDRTINAISIDLGETHLEAERVKARVVCRERHQVRGIVLKTREIPFSDWITTLVGLLAEEARRSEGTRAALQSLLLQ